MARPQKAPSKSIRQSVTIPAPLAQSIRRLARQRHWTMSRAVIALAERGIQAEAEANRSLHAAHERFLQALSDADQAAAGRDLIRAIFGERAIAEDSVL